MFRTIAFAGIVALALGPSPVDSPVQGRRVTLEAADCSRHNMMFGDYEVARAEQFATVPVNGALDIRPESNGGVQIERGTGSTFGITACIGAGGRSRADAQAAADAVRLVIEGNRVRVTGANMSGSRNGIQSWSVQLIVTAPEGTSIDVETANGPIGVAGFSGKLTARASNGPISLDEVIGSVNARASNGPISVTGSRGEFDIETANGPIDVRLSGRRWDGHLTARASNGPLSLRVPADYQSGVEVTSSSHSPWSCRAAACSGSRGNRDWDDRNRILRLGADPVVVRLSTVNGPVTVSER